MKSFLTIVPVVLAVVMLGGCGKNESPSGPSAKPAAEASLEHLRLSQEPAGKKDVKEVRKSSTNGEDVVIAGRIAGSTLKPFTGKAAFTIVDMEYEPCVDEGCGNPFCYLQPKELAEVMTLVKFVDEQGKTLPQDIEKSLALKAFQTVVVRGKVQRDEDNNVVILANGLFVSQ